VRTNVEFVRDLANVNDPVAPAVTLDMMRQAYFRDANANYNDIVWRPIGTTWKNQSLDVDTSVRYLYIFSNTNDAGPIVLDLPAAIPRPNSSARSWIAGRCRLPISAWTARAANI
jgi:hypothetical protein